MPSKQTVISLLMGLLVTLIGSALTYLTAYVTGHSFGVYTPFVVTGWAFVANVIRKWVDGPVFEKFGIVI